MSLSLRPRSSRAVLPLLLVAVVLVGYYGWITLGLASGTPFSPLTAAVVGGVLLLGLLTYLVLSGTSRRRGRSGDDPPAVDGSFPLAEEPVHDVTEEPVQEVTEEPVDEEHPEPATAHAVDLYQLADLAVPERVTQLHIQTLESALEEQSARIAELERESTSGHDLMRVLLTVRALRQRVQGSSESETVLNRVEAAVLRLSSSSEPARPALPAPAPGARVTFVPAGTAPTGMATPAPTAMVALPQSVAVEPAPVAAPPLVAEPAPAAAPPLVAAQPVGAPPVVPPAVQPVEEPVTDEHVAPVPPLSRSVAPVDEPVLPVPPPPVQVAARGSRWRRRGAA